MENAAIRLEKLQKALTGLSDVCSSGGPVNAFPENFRNGFRNFGIGLIVCTQGEFRFSLASGAYTAAAGETVFIPEDTPFRITGQSEDMEVSILIYKVQPIKDILGNLVYSVHLYSRMSPDLPCVWKTGDEEDIITYMTLIGTDTPSDDNLFAVYERKLLLLSLTYRLCAIFQRNGNLSPAHPVHRPVLYLPTRCGILCRQTVPVAQIPVRRFQGSMRLHRSGTGIQGHHPPQHVAAGQHQQDSAGNFRRT